MNSTVDHSNEKCYHCGTNYKQHVCYNCGCTDEDYPEPEIKATAYKVYGAKSKKTKFLPLNLKMQRQLFNLK